MTTKATKKTAKKTVKAPRTTPQLSSIQKRVLRAIAFGKASTASWRTKKPGAPSGRDWMQGATLRLAVEVMERAVVSLDLMARKLRYMAESIRADTECGCASGCTPAAGPAAELKRRKESAEKRRATPTTRARRTKHE